MKSNNKGDLKMMKRQPGRSMTGAACLAAVLILAGCAARTTAPSGEAAAARVSEKAAAPVAGGVVLEYKMPAGRVLRYQDESEVREVADVMGMTNESRAVTTAQLSFQANGRKDGNHLLGVTIEDWSTSIASSQGDMSLDMGPVKGKSFDMVLSPFGSEVDVSGAEAITYESVTGQRNVASAFNIFFSDLPGQPVKIGDTWPSSFVIEEKGGPMSMRVDAQGVNTLDGFEIVDGMECARISAAYTGTISGTGTQQGADLAISGTLKGTDIWHFAVKEGIYVGSAGDMINDITIAVSGAQTMTLPVTQTRKTAVKLIGR